MAPTSPTGQVGAAIGVCPSSPGHRAPGPRRARNAPSTSPATATLPAAEIGVPCRARTKRRPISNPAARRHRAEAAFPAGSPVHLVRQFRDRMVPHARAYAWGTVFPSVPAPRETMTNRCSLPDVLFTEGFLEPQRPICADDTTPRSTRRMRRRIGAEYSSPARKHESISALSTPSRRSRPW